MSIHIETPVKIVIKIRVGTGIITCYSDKEVIFKILTFGHLVRFYKIARVENISVPSHMYTYIPLLQAALVKMQQQSKSTNGQAL